MYKVLIDDEIEVVVRSFNAINALFNMYKGHKIVVQPIDEDERKMYNV